MENATSGDAFRVRGEATDLRVTCLEPLQAEIDWEADCATTGLDQREFP